jgi:hypothetical protein
MSTPDPILSLPEGLREPVLGVSFTAYLLVEAARLDGLPEQEVLRWLGVQESTFAQAEEAWGERVADELAWGEAGFDALYLDLLERALSAWARPVPPLDQEVEAWTTFQRHALAALDPEAVARRAGLTAGDELRLARLWRDRLAAPELVARAEAALSSPLSPMPAVTPAPFPFPPPREAP